MHRLHRADVVVVAARWLLLLVLLGLVACDPDSSSQAVYDDDWDEDEPLSDEERRYLEAGRPFIEAVAARDYDKAYAQLSRDARRSMTLEQFVPHLGDEPDPPEQTQPIANVSAAVFAELMQRMAAHLGTPDVVQDLYIAETDPDILAGKGDAMDTLFSIGAMPDALPTANRRAALRGQVRIADPNLEQAEYAQGGEGPYFNIKYVLIEEEGALKVGYFEFIPPSIWD